MTDCHIIPRAATLGQIVTALDTHPINTLMLHLGVSRLGLLDALKPRPQMIKDYAELIIEAAGCRSLLLPAFSYSYCRSRVYDVAADKCDLGPLNDYFRTVGLVRTHTPVFNFFLHQHDPTRFPLTPSERGFGPKSTFAHALAADAWIGFLGADLEACTFVHFVEDANRIGYRYDKRFDGVVRSGGSEQAMVFSFHVRPLVDGAVLYDWPRLEDELLQAGLLHIYPVGNNALRLISARAVFDFWSTCLLRDPLYLLTPASRGVAERCYEQYGNPLTAERVDAPFAT